MIKYLSTPTSVMQARILTISDAKPLQGVMAFMRGSTRVVPVAVVALLFLGIALFVALSAESGQDNI